MALSRAEVQSRLQPYLLVHLPKEVLDLMTNAEFVDVFNDVAKDLNGEAQLNQERFKNTINSTTAEDALCTNFLLAGNILRIYSFKYESSDCDTQRYSYINDRIVLKESASDIEVDIAYLRDCEDIDVVADEIDLPNGVLQDYVELLKIKFRMDFGKLAEMTYDQALKFYGEKARQHVQPHALEGEGVRRSWLGLDTDDNIYEIRSQWVGLENFTADISGIYTYVGS